MLYGTADEVKSRCRKTVSSIRKGAQWDELLGPGESVDVATHPGLLILNGPAPVLSKNNHFYCYTPWFFLKNAIGEGRIDPKVEDQVFAASLKTAWGTLGLVAAVNVMWLRPAERYRPFLDSAVRHWDVLDANGERYTIGSIEGRRLWDVPNNIKYVLANMGVSTSVLRASLPPGGLSNLLHYTDAWDGIPVVDRPARLGSDVYK